MGAEGLGIPPAVSPEPPPQGPWHSPRPNSHSGWANWMGKLAKLVLLSPPPCWDPSALLRCCLGTGTSRQGPCLKKRWQYLMQILAAFVNSKLYKKVVQEKGGKRRAVSPSPFPDSVLIIAVWMPRTVLFFPYNTVGKYWGINKTRHYIPEITTV